MSGSSTPAGWYPDPQDPGQQRYWDGVAWTEATRPSGIAPPPPPTGAYGAPGGYGAPAQTGYGYAARGPAPNNYLVWAILATLFCCLPAGIVAIVKAASVNGKWNAGDQAGAEEAANQAKTWVIISAVVGLAFSAVLLATGSFNFEFDSGT
jgi:hypothetical protein